MQVSGKCFSLVFFYSDMLHFNPVTPGFGSQNHGRELPLVCVISYSEHMQMCLRVADLMVTGQTSV